MNFVKMIGIVRHVARLAATSVRNDCKLRLHQQKRLSIKHQKLTCIVLLILPSFVGKVVCSSAVWCRRIYVIFNHKMFLKHGQSSVFSSWPCIGDCGSYRILVAREFQIVALWQDIAPSYAARTPLARNQSLASPEPIKMQIYCSIIYQIKLKSISTKMALL